MRADFLLAAALALALIAASLTAAQPVTTQAPRQATGLTPSPFTFTVESLSILDSSSDRGVIQLVVSYFGKRVLLGSTAEVELQCNASVSSSQPVLLGSWRPGTSKLIQLTLNTSSAPSMCPARLVVSWSNTWDDSLSTLTYEGGTTTVDFSIVACWGEDLAVRVVPSTLYTGTLNLVSLQVENKGRESVSSLTVSVSLQGAVLVDGEIPAVFKIPALKPGQVMTLPISIIPISATPALQVSLSYLSCTGSTSTRTFTIPLFSASGQSILVAPDPAVITAGSLNRVNLHVVNAGNVPLQGVKVILSLQKSQLSVNPSFIEVGDLGPGEDKVFPVEVMAPATASSSEAVAYQVLFTTSGGSTSSLQGTFTLFAIFASRLAITNLEAVPQQPRVGSNLILAVTLVNDGVLPVYAVNVSVEASSGLKPLRTTYTYLGQLNPQVLTSVPFSFRVQEEGVQELRVVVTFRDSYGTVRAVERSLLVSAVAAESPELTQRGASWNGLAIGVLITAAVGVGALTLWKKVSRREAG